MASIRKTLDIAVPAATAWAALRQLDQTHRLFAPVLTDSRIEQDIRTVTFNGGMTVLERIIDVNDEGRRIAYTVIGRGFDHHNASMEILELDAESCRFVWVTDLLPAERAALVQPLVEQGSAALKRNLEAGK
jgi:hypothetical protein